MAGAERPRCRRQHGTRPPPRTTRRTCRRRGLDGAGRRSLIDAGDPPSSIDGTDSDVGAYGGDYLIVEDKDGDGHLDVDCDDEDPPSTRVPMRSVRRPTWTAHTLDYDADGDGVLHPPVAVPTATTRMRPRRTRDCSAAARARG